MTWTDERVEQLEKMWREGMSASQIARSLGGVSRSAVLGKLHRHGLTGNRHQPSIPGHKAVRARKPKVTTSPQIKAPPVPLPPLAPDAPGMATVHTLKPRACRWPIGDPLAAGFTFCGQAANGVYCDTHASRAYDRASTAARRTANDLARSLRRYTR